VGCSSKNNAAPTITLQISPPVASVVINLPQQFASLVLGSSDTGVTWSVSCASGVTKCGGIDTNGLYTAPNSVPSTPTATITATAHASSSVTATATVTIISGITIAINNQTTNVTIGTNESFTFSATVSNPGCSVTADPTCKNVTWSVPTTAGVGTIDSINPTDPTLPRTGLYHAPTTVPSPSTVTVTATSVADTTVTANTTVTIVTATDPTLSSVSPNTAALGSIFLDAFITGTNFITTDRVFIEGTAVAPADVFEVSNTMLRVRITADKLASPKTLKITASQLNVTGSPATCTPDPTQCQIVVTKVRPSVIGPSPDSVPQGTSGSISFNVNGGFFGTSSSPAVTATYDGQTRAAQPHPVTDVTAIPPDPALARQLSVTIGGGSNSGDFGIPGLHQVAIQNSADSTKYAATNLAVQPADSSIPLTVPATPISVGGLPSSVTCPTVSPGSHPSDVAFNGVTGIAVVANQCSNDITVIRLTQTTPTIAASVVAQSICTAAVGLPPGTSSPCPNSGPKAVAVATVTLATNAVRNFALVANSTSSSVAVVDLDLQSVTKVIPTQDPPAGVGIDPSSGRALVAINTRGYGVLLDLTKTPPEIIGVVTISTGPNSRVAVEPHLHWAIATPGVVGSLGIVDLNSQTTNLVTSISRSAGTVTVNVVGSTTANPQPELAVQVGDAVFVQGVTDSSFNGIFTVNAVGPGANTFSYAQTNAPNVTQFNTVGTIKYAQPVATLTVTPAIQGVGMNSETQRAVLLDPTTSGNVTFLSLLDQSVTPLPTPPTSANFTRVGNVAGAFNPLTNVALVVNQFASSNYLALIDPNSPRVINQAFTPMPAGTMPVAVALDPGTNTAFVANQGSNDVSIFSLGAISRLSIVETSPKTLTAVSSLSSASTAPSPLPQLTIIGKGFTSTTVPRLDGIGLPVISFTDRQIIASLGSFAALPSSPLTHARRFAVDVQDTTSGLVSNAADFSVIQQVDVSGNGCSTAPSPTGVAVDSQQDLAVVSLFGCNTVALIDLNSGTGKTVAVGANPLGVAVLSRLHKAVVANNGSGSASVVDELQQTVTNTITTGSGPMGVATDEATGEAAVANSVANTATVINLTTASASSVTTGQRPVALAFNYTNHQLGVANSTSNSASFGDASSASLGTTFPSISLPTSVIYDPVANNFLVNSSTTNTLQVIDPGTFQQRSFRIGINPTALAYNYLTSTLVSTNTLSHTLTVVDFLGHQVRAVLPLPAPSLGTLALAGSLQFGVDIHPRLNLAVVADTANGNVLFVPLPH
jgi:DNA-binding beta-propeller fold protein YncE